MDVARASRVWVTRPRLTSDVKGDPLLSNKEAEDLDLPTSLTFACQQDRTLLANALRRQSMTSTARPPPCLLYTSRDVDAALEMAQEALRLQTSTAALRLQELESLKLELEASKDQTTNSLKAADAAALELNGLRSQHATAVADLHQQLKQKAADIKFLEAERAELARQLESKVREGQDDAAQKKLLQSCSEVCPDTPCSSTIGAVYHNAAWSEDGQQEQQVPKSQLDQAQQRIAELEQQLEQLSRQLNTSQQTATGPPGRLSSEANTQREAREARRRLETEMQALEASLAQLRCRKASSGSTNRRRAAEKNAHAIARQHAAPAFAPAGPAAGGAPAN
ncbi:hypothetical protein WJX73_007669 [Symbiochloris irregularis]|uniref:Uncharacterized protein n=1 Tax=Symbiochloris irregularis TaxID=706552 RepID=A0AAW1NY27_9CHLO